MADNYLERRMEDLRSGRLTADTARMRAKAPARNPHRLSVVFPEMRILVADGLSDFGKALVKAFRSVGMKVAFCATDATEGRRFAQESGARSCNAARPDTVLADILKAWGGLDLIVKAYDGTKKASRTEAHDGLPPTLAVNPALFPGETPESIARIALILAHPDFRSLC